MIEPLSHMPGLQSSKTDTQARSVEAALQLLGDATTQINRLLRAHESALEGQLAQLLLEMQTIKLSAFSIRAQVAAAQKLLLREHPIENAFQPNEHCGVAS